MHKTAQLNARICSKGSKVIAVAACSVQQRHLLGGAKRINSLAEINQLEFICRWPAPTFCRQCCSCHKEFPRSARNAEGERFYNTPLSIPQNVMQCVRLTRCVDRITPGSDGNWHSTQLARDLSQQLGVIFQCKRIYTRLHKGISNPSCIHTHESIQRGG